MPTTVNKKFTLFYWVVFIKNINLLHLLYWWFPGKFMNFSEAATGGVLKKSCRRATLLKTDSNRDVFLRNLWVFLIWSLRTTVSETCSFTYGLPFLITCTSGSNWYISLGFCIIIYGFVYQFSLHYYWYFYNKGSRPVVFCKKVFPTNFADFTRKTCSKDSFLIKLHIYRV